MDRRDDYQLTKSRLHRKILDRMGLEKLRKTSEVNAEVVPLSFAERERLAQEILDELFRGNLEGGDAAGIAVKKITEPQFEQRLRCGASGMNSARVQAGQPCTNRASQYFLFCELNFSNLCLGAGAYNV